MQRGLINQFSVRLTYYCNRSELTGQKTGKFHLCALHLMFWKSHKKLQISDTKEIFLSQISWFNNFENDFAINYRLLFIAHFFVTFWWELQKAFESIFLSVHTTVFETKMWQRQNFIRWILISAAHNFSEYLRRGLM